jgi:hypothetical protein
MLVSYALPVYLFGWCWRRVPKNDDKMTELDKEGLNRLEAKRKEKDFASRHGKPAFRQAHKRKEGEVDIFVAEKRSKKRKYERIDIDWGLVARPAGDTLEEENVGKFLREPPSKTQCSLTQTKCLSGEADIPVGYGGWRGGHGGGCQGDGGHDGLRCCY